MSTETSLDDQVALEVMGWTREKVEVVKGFTEDCWRSEGRLEVAYTWHPTYSWRQAGKVLDRITELGWTLVLHSSPHKGAEVRFSKWIDGRKGREQISGGWIVDLSPQRAICLAALGAVRREKEDEAD